MNKEPVLFLAIVKEGMASRLLKRAKQAGASGGTIIRAYGTVQSNLLRSLGLQGAEREIFLTIVPKEKEADIHAHLEDALKLKKKGTGVLFSFDVSSYLGNQNHSYLFNEADQGSKDQLLVTIVQRDLADQVVDAARDEGAKGATILHGRGSGAHEKSTIFSIQIEPEKEIVWMVLPANKIKQVTDNISETMKITEPGHGLIFSLPISSVSGLIGQGKKA
ncbi:P-II family nitrogen regulator [Aerococcus urinae]|uniref:P-II family nitrogen regulator n=3 Tax=Aerococcus urinae TaxID=1376 RepID=A0ABT4C2F0_9LACT|nr:P-II family nitrogen regulator [Aerococcus urinae]MCY3032784.1 P-II family nitrogen regulator [Aerococcus urinae]MCY3037464.1 P-II family nitrogen regulator [Aerococcus urinae]MCY3044831.1 P-II family nitrogen regulator [Aerococcus urinae]MCY3048285.1 P-II family nitrogen regulator [Aerococcus urinae]MCY3049847.1 P-II family nitrogen regulator [Aerococcus urinae]